ncbi:LuxR C-terminal-related transcriptional regulator [Paraburkholderia terricola]|uniref:Transcriptional regulator, LuxR family n=1 Tax=Paraburkholderia terricola TaxID=169427 RepID=A0A1M6ILI3_9BURK|nr:MULTISPECIES: response regulator transcription factor [Paraburkholderia]SDN54376.1 transcriptional regulator, LuxR family [Paraburkholderia sediminicola]SHJ35257.1 transcriptional regulator, LuxR family [Paraburkholderia terricola]
MNVLMIDSPPLFVAGVADVLWRRDSTCQVWSAQCADDIYRIREEFPPGTVGAVTLEWDERAARMGWPKLLQDTLGTVPWLFVVRTVYRQAIADALMAGAAGIVERHASADEFADALCRVASGAIYVPPSYGLAAGVASGESPSGDRAFERLTPRQREVLRLLAEGKSNKQICRVLNVAEGTIKNHLYALFRQIGVSNRTEAALWLSRHITPESAYLQATVCAVHE